MGTCPLHKREPQACRDSLEPGILGVMGELWGAGGGGQPNPAASPASSFYATGQQAVCVTSFSCLKLSSPLITDVPSFWFFPTSLGTGHKEISGTPGTPLEVAPHPVVCWSQIILAPES